MRARNIAERAMPCSPRKLNCAGPSSAWLQCAAPCRRAGVVPEDYDFDGESGPVRLSELFGDKQTLIVYSYMFGPQRARPCPVCTSMLSAWDGSARNVRHRAALAVTARSPIERLLEVKKERGWEFPPARLGPERRLHPHLRKPRGCRHSGAERVHAARRHASPFLERRDDRRDGRSGSGSTRSPGYRSALDHPRSHPGRPRRRLLSEVGLRRTWCREVRVRGLEVERGDPLSCLRDAWAFAAVQNEGLAAVVGGVVDLLPEADKVVDRRDHGDQHGEVNRRNRNPFHRDDEEPPKTHWSH